jgi:hypothetical protein
MARFALDYFGFDNAAHYKDLLAFAESNRAWLTQLFLLSGVTPDAND